MLVSCVVAEAEAQAAMVLVSAVASASAMVIVWTERLLPRGSDFDFDYGTDCGFGFDLAYRLLGLPSRRLNYHRVSLAVAVS